MFTGIIESLGRVQEIKPHNGNLIFVIHCEPVSKKLGASIAINGTCLTMIAFNENSFEVEAIPETLRLTNLGLLKEGDHVNLEEPLKLNQGLGGHFVSGHVDFKTQVISIIPDGESTKITFHLPEKSAKFFAYKGSASVNGVSLTISARSPESFEVSLIPYTLEKTNLGKLQVGDWVNIEIDIIARYLENLIPKL